MRLEKRHTTSRRAMILAPAGAILFTLIVSALLVWWAGAPIGKTYVLLLKGGFGSVFALSETLTRAIPLILTGLAAAVPSAPVCSTSAPKANSTPARWQQWPSAGCMAEPVSSCRPGCCCR